MENTHEGHRKRLRELFRNEGLDAFPANNVLELLLFYANPRGDTNEIAKRLLSTFGSLQNVWDAPYEDLCNVKGLGENGATLIKLIPEISRRYVLEKSQFSGQVTCSADIGKYIVPKFLGLLEEMLLVLVLDNRGTLIECTPVAKGDATSAVVAIPDIIELANKKGGTKIILAHNHPIGFALPSKEDIAFTKTIKEELSKVGITLLDHLIVSGGDYVSMKDSDLI